MKGFFLLLLIASSLSAFSHSDLLIRYPPINTDGSLISFSYQGDIWTVPASGGKGTRLTVHEGYESNPLFSPDGKNIAFSGARYGNNDIFVIPSEGGSCCTGYHCAKFTRLDRQKVPMTSSKLLWMSL